MAEEHKNGWAVDLSSWVTMEPFIEWRDAAATMDFKAMNRIMAQAIKTWPYEGDPASADAYVKLTPQQWNKASTEVGRVVGNFFRGEAD